LGNHRDGESWFRLRIGMAIVESPDELMAFADGEIVLEIDIECAPGFLEDIGAGVAGTR
jgi:hypothetical protein